MLGLSSTASSIHLIIQTVMDFGKKQQSCKFSRPESDFDETKKEDGEGVWTFQDSLPSRRSRGNGSKTFKSYTLPKFSSFQLKNIHHQFKTSLLCFSLFIQFTSSHLSTSNSASVKSIPDYVYSQLSSPHVTSPEAKKLHQEIYSVSQRGTNLSCSEVN